MPPRKAPTARQRRLGTELRRLREHAGLSPNEAAALLGSDRTNISNIEAGRFGVSTDRVRALAANYECSDPALIEALAAMAEERDKGWWEEYRGQLPTDLLDLAEVEAHAIGIRAVQVMHVNGLLQTEDYAKAVFAEGVRAQSPAELRRVLSFRMRRRDVLDRATPPDCIFVIHESALRMEFGGPKVARAQLEHLLEASERDNVTIRVLPFAAGGFPGSGLSTNLMLGRVPQLDTAQFDTPAGASLVDAETHLKNYRAAVDRTLGKSLTPQKSRDFIHAVIAEK